MSVYVKMFSVNFSTVLTQQLIYRIKKNLFQLHLKTIQCCLYFNECRCAKNTFFKQIFNTDRFNLSCMEANFDTQDTK